MSKPQNNVEKLAAEVAAAEVAAAEVAAAEVAAAEVAAAEPETTEAKVLVKVSAKLFDMRDPFTKNENPWLFVGEEKEVELSNWVQSQIDAGYLEIVTAE